MTRLQMDSFSSIKASWQGFFSGNIVSISHKMCVLPHKKAKLQFLRETELVAKRLEFGLKYQ